MYLRYVCGLSEAECHTLFFLVRTDASLDDRCDTRVNESLVIDWALWITSANV